VGVKRLVPVDGEPITTEAIGAEIDRILESDAFRNSDALRRLLRFLADKMLSGEADQLKEYSVGIDALGKPDTYDPRRDSTVRIQVGRLRQKLSDYYGSEGSDDPVIIDLPKGHFKLVCEARSMEGAAATVEPQMVIAPALPAALPANLPAGQPPIPKRGRASAILAAALALTTLWGALVTWQLWRDRQDSGILRAIWTPDLEQLWQPLLKARLPLIVSIADPPFVQFKGFGAYRDLTLNRWEDIVKSPQVTAIRKALGDPELQKNVYYSPIGEVSASFLIGRLLGPRVPALSLMRASELSLQQLADNNVLFIGASVFFDDQLKRLPIQLDLVNARPGIHNNRPRPGEPTVLSDQVPSGALEDGEAYILVTHLPGPLRTTDIVSFTSNRTPGRLAAVGWFTNPEYAHTLVAKLRKPNGQIPRYYQLVLKVKYKAGVPTETTYVLHHELQ
jgi:hypothetical protein